MDVRSGWFLERVWAYLVIYVYSVVFPEVRFRMLYFSDTIWVSLLDLIISASRIISFCCWGTELTDRPVDSHFLRPAM